MKLIQADQHVIIVAGGSGTRMGSTIPKQFLELSGLPILIRTISAFYRYSEELNIVLVLPESESGIWSALCKKFNFDIPHTLIAGGKTRFDSVKNGLATIDGGIVAIHDGVRPLITSRAIEKAFIAAKAHGSAVLSVPLKDSIRKFEGGKNVSALRSDFVTIQTPQLFEVKKLKEAFDVPYQELFTDDANVYQHAGHDIHLVTGDYQNIKITTPEDMIIAEALLENRIG